jgi:hypothetical protein
MDFFRLKIFFKKKLPFFGRVAGKGVILKSQRMAFLLKLAKPLSK